MQSDACATPICTRLTPGSDRPTPDVDTGPLKLKINPYSSESLVPCHKYLNSNECIVHIHSLEISTHIYVHVHLQEGSSDVGTESNFIRHPPL